MLTLLRASIYIDAAEQEEPGHLPGAFIKFKILLQQGDSNAAVQQITRMQSMEYFSLDFIRVRALLRMTLSGRHRRHCQRFYRVDMHAAAV